MSRQVVNENSTDMCAACDIDLATCETIWAAEGALYCSRECGIHGFKVAYGDEAEKHFDEVAEEINPHDIGIGKDTEECEWCHELYESSELVKTDLGTLCSQCVQAIRSRGEEVIILEGGM